MKVVDANVLLYAYNRDAERHLEARRWLDHALSGRATVGFTWVVLLAFIRIATKPGLFPRPVDPEVAMAQVQSWLSSSAAMILEPGPRHADILATLLSRSSIYGNLTTDAHLAALAMEHRGEIVSYDGDFDRFDRVRWHRPGSEFG